MTTSKRLTLYDYFDRDGSEEIHIVQDKTGKPRVIKKKAEPLPEMYANESQLKKAAADLLSRIPRCRLIKTDNMPLFVKNRRVPTREPGMSDQHLCICGLFVALEAKMPGKNLDPKLKQPEYRDSILAAGGIFIVYHSLKELVSELKRFRLVPRNFEI